MSLSGSHGVKLLFKEEQKGGVRPGKNATDLVR